MQLIGKRVAKERIVTRSPNQHISIVAAVDRVVAIATIEEIGKLATIDIVIAIFAIDMISAGLAKEDVIASLAIGRVIAIAGIDEIVVCRSANHFMGVGAIAGGAIGVEATIGAHIQEIFVATGQALACNCIGLAVLAIIQACR